MKKRLDSSSEKTDQQENARMGRKYTNICDNHISVQTKSFVLLKAKNMRNKNKLAFVWGRGNE